MFGIGTQELLIILAAVLIFFGGRRIPEIARALGNAVRDFRRAVTDVQREVDLETLRRTAQPSEPARRMGSGQGGPGREGPQDGSPAVSASLPGAQSEPVQGGTDSPQSGRLPGVRAGDAEELRQAGEPAGPQAPEDPAGRTAGGPSPRDGRGDA